MSRECYVCSKSKMGGARVTRRGLAKKSGGIGMHVVKTFKRTFYPNLQPARIQEDGTVKSVKVCTKCLRAGKVLKA